MVNKTMIIELLTENGFWLLGGEGKTYIYEKNYGSPVEVTVNDEDVKIFYASENNIDLLTIVDVENEDNFLDIMSDFLRKVVLLEAIDNGKELCICEHLDTPSFTHGIKVPF